jgi:hypothetical protein
MAVKISPFVVTQPIDGSATNALYFLSDLLQLEGWVIDSPIIIVPAQSGRHQEIKAMVWPNQSMFDHSQAH